MPDEPVVADGGREDWDGWPADQVAARGTVQWQTLVSGGLTPTSGLTAGTARLEPGGVLRPHRHAQPELYFVRTGTGVVTIAGSARAVGPGTTVFIPGDAVHGIENTGSAELRFDYVLAADAFEDVEYIF